MNKLARAGCMAAALATFWHPSLTAAGDKPASLAAAKSLYETNCMVCHPLERSLATKADRSGWAATLQKMIANGAQFDQRQADLILEYLTAKSFFETKCNVCHEFARPLAAIKNPQEWRATVATMGARKPGLLTEDEAKAIGDYLSLAGPAK